MLLSSHDFRVLVHDVCTIRLCLEALPATLSPVPLGTVVDAAQCALPILLADAGLAAVIFRPVELGRLAEAGRRGTEIGGSGHSPQALSSTQGFIKAWVLASAEATLLMLALPERNANGSALVSSLIDDKFLTKLIEP